MLLSIPACRPPILERNATRASRTTLFFGIGSSRIAIIVIYCGRCGAHRRLQRHLLHLCILDCLRSLDMQQQLTACPLTADSRPLKRSKIDHYCITSNIHVTVRTASRTSVGPSNNQSRRWVLLAKFMMPGTAALPSQDTTVLYPEYRVQLLLDYTQEHTSTTPGGGQVQLTLIIRCLCSSLSAVHQSVSASLGRVYRLAVKCRCTYTNEKALSHSLCL